ncbi:MAG: histidinol dehydrogenase [Actinobacteria bacterium]|nr:histidinol dehydrogenase [Actinomycetota bacterium]NBY15605.1 histidinol dehydrogenase [Actinomycetota bacterium]
MLNTLDLRGGTRLARELRDVVPRAEFDLDAVLEQVRPIVADVAARGEQAAQEWSEKLDGVRAPTLRVPQMVLDSALESLPPDVRDALLEAIRRVRIVHEQQVRQDSSVSVAPGGTVSESWIPVARVGLYVPGGRAVYPSSVVMNVVPAQIAGVESIAVVSPPQKDNDGWPHPTILAACSLLGITEVYSVGGAQAIALLAHGTVEIEPVNLVTGPGNMWVTAAKRLLKGRIGIDSEAGPTEIAILADDSANPAFVAADLISQAEHDVVAASVLVTDSPELASAVQEQLVAQVRLTKHSERVTTALTGSQSAIVLVDDLDQAIAVVDAYAAEHLEIHTRDAAVVARRVKNAGAIFIGDYSPVSLGDYAAGSNHVLPTGGCACHSSGLSVQTFLRGVHYVEYSKSALAEIASTVTTLANAEDLPGHAAAVEIRFP